MNSSDDSSKTSPQNWREMLWYAVRHPGEMLTLLGVLILLSPALLERWKRGDSRE